MAGKIGSKKIEKILAIKGMNDIVPPESWVWEKFEEQVRALMHCFSYENIRTPIVESTALFVRGLGEVTDIVEKEMYSFEDRLNGDALTLRPENTAGVVRAVVEHSMLYGGGKRLYYMGPMFRHERPQRGRYRQFHQVGAEALGFSGGELDAELILLAHTLFQKLGLTGIELQINSLGQPNERLLHRAALIAYFEKNIEALDAEAQRRLHLNPLRLLDSKNPAMQKIIENAPQLLDFLGDASKKHLNVVMSILDKNGVFYKINPRLVRGMDYYNLTVFEFVTTQLGSQGTVCAGGRYDYLTEQIGGNPAPAVGWGMGVERVLELLKEQNKWNCEKKLDIYAVIPEEKAFPEAMVCLQKLREIGLSVQMHAASAEGLSGMKAQLKRADSSGARYALIFGAEELSRGAVAVKPLRNPGQLQMTYSIDEASQWGSALQLIN